MTALLCLLLVQFDKSTTVYDACQRVRYKVPEAAELKQRKYKLHEYIFDSPGNETQGVMVNFANTAALHVFTIYGDPMIEEEG